MGIVSKEIEVIAIFLKSNYPKPVRFRLKEKENNIVINIDKVLYIDKEKLAGNLMLVYRCQSIINNAEKQFELKYDLCKCRWVLFKI